MEATSSASCCLETTHTLALETDRGDGKEPCWELATGQGLIRSLAQLSHVNPQPQPHPRA